MINTGTVEGIMAMAFVLWVPLTFHVKRDSFNSYLCMALVRLIDCKSLITTRFVQYCQFYFYVLIICNS